MSVATEGVTTTGANVPGKEEGAETGPLLLLLLLWLLLGCMTGTSVSNSTALGADTTTTDCRLGASEGVTVEGDAVVRLDGVAVGSKDLTWTEGALVSTVISDASDGSSVKLTVGCIVLGTCGGAEGLTVVRRVGRIEVAVS
jgi:hypothetical protein